MSWALDPLDFHNAPLRVFENPVVYIVRCVGYVYGGGETTSKTAVINT
jgi:hypothetical protein